MTETPRPAQRPKVTGYGQEKADGNPDFFLEKIERFAAQPVYLRVVSTVRKDSEGL